MNKLLKVLGCVALSLAIVWILILIIDYFVWNFL